MIGDEQLAIAEQILHEHEMVREMMRQLELAVAEREFVCSTPDWSQYLGEQLLAFRSHLQKHFELEELGGFMQDVVTMSPHLTDDVEKLRQEHGRILKDTDELINSMQHPTSATRTPLETLQDRLMELFFIIKAHETEENELIQHVYYQEVGAVD